MRSHFVCLAQGETILIVPLVVISLGIAAGASRLQSVRREFRCLVRRSCAAHWPPCSPECKCRRPAPQWYGGVGVSLRDTVDYDNVCARHVGHIVTHTQRA